MTLSKSGNEEIFFLLHRSIGISGIIKLMRGHQKRLPGSKAL
jgi:hypothetical protein